MASRVRSEHQSPSRPPIRLLGSVLLLGTLLAWWGTRDHRRLFGGSLREPLAAGGVVLPQVTQEESALLDRGSQISQRQCAGCHEMATRSSGPSYQEIVNFYRLEFPISPGNSDVRARLASAVESELSLDDRIDLASWILNNFDRDKSASEGVGK